MNIKPEKTVRIIGVPMDLGASRRGTDMGPSALRIAGLGAAIRGMGYTLAREEDIVVPAMETRPLEDSEARFKPQILSVCTELAGRVKELMNAGEFPLVIGGDHSIAMGTVSGAAAHFRERGEEMGLIWFDTPVAINQEQSESLRDYVHELQPECLVSGRVGHGVGHHRCTVVVVLQAVRAHALRRPSTGPRSKRLPHRTPQRMLAAGNQLPKPKGYK